MSNEYKIKLNNYQIKYLFKNIRKLNGGKNLIAKKLGISTVTLDEYLKTGKNYLDKFDNLLEPIYEIDIDLLDEEISKTKYNYVNEFLTTENYTGISDKNRGAFDVFFLNKKEELKESYIFNFQKSILDNLKLSDIEDENKMIKKLITFKLIYDRAQLSLDEELLYLKNRYSKSSSRHVNFLVKDLERRNKEDFGDNKEETKQITVNQQFNNFTHYSIEHDKALNLMKLKNENSENIIEVKKEDDD